MVSIQKIFEGIVERLESRAESYKRFSTLRDLDRNMIRASILSDIAGAIRSVISRVGDDGVTIDDGRF